MRSLKLPLAIVVLLSFAFGLGWGIKIYRGREHTARSAVSSQAALQVLSYKGMLDPQLIKEFEDSSGLIVQVREADSPESLWEKLETPTDPPYDLIAIMSYQLPLANQLVRLQPLDVKKLKNLSNLAADFRRIPGDLNHEFVLPISWGLTGILYDTRKVSQPLETWRAALQTKGKNRIGVLASTVDLVRFVGGDEDENESETVSPKNQEFLRRSITKFVEGMTVSQDFLSASTLFQGAEPPSILQINHGETAFPPADDKVWKFVLPEERASFWILSMALTRDAKHAAEAHQFLDFLMEKESALALVKSSRQASTNRLVEESSLDQKLKPSFLRQVPLNRYVLLRDFSRSREVRAILRGENSTHELPRAQAPPDRVDAAAPEPPRPQRKEKRKAASLPEAPAADPDDETATREQAPELKAPAPSEAKASGDEASAE